MIDINLEQYGLQYLFPYQRLVVSNILHNEEVQEMEQSEEDSRRNQIVILPTAAGKSLCFQLPAPRLSGVTIVAYPLLGLIADQGRRLTSYNIPHRILTGALSRAEKTNVLKEAREHKIAIILTNPETLLLPYVLSALKDIPCSHLVIDEAHCISEWGKSFRPSYRMLGTLHKELVINSISAFTATASSEIIDDIKHILFNDEAVHIIRGNPDRENIHYSVRPTLSIENTLIDIVQNVFAPTQTSSNSDGVDYLSVPMIIFCPTRASTERYARILRYYTGSDKIFFYHAGLSNEEKAQTERWFFESDSGILCATCAYGMGMDKSNIRSVVHTFIPATQESYLQESGRGGRDGKNSYAILYYSALTLERMRSRDAQGPLSAYCTNVSTCRRAQLLQALGVDSVVCSGCDVCDASHHGLTFDAYRAFQYIRRHQRTMTLQQLAEKRRLCMYMSRGNRLQTTRCLYHLKEEGFLRVRKQGLWKNTYELSHTARAGMRRILE